jgi:ubiquinone/menaquinone biosynthesis C-methylase UbiE
MSNGDFRAELRSTWESAAPGWAKWEEVFASGLVDVTDAMLDMAGVDTDMRVLDIACGAGSQSLRAAQRVGPKGCVVASDISATMLAYVQENAKRSGLSNIRTLECFAEEFPAAQDAFDAAICRLGLMLFPAPKVALKAVGSVLRPGARFAGLVFTTAADNPFMLRPMQILLRHAEKEPPAAGEPGIFALGGPGVFEALLLDCGFSDVETKVVRAPLRLSSAAEALEMMQQAFGAYRAVVADLSSDARSDAWSDVFECLKDFEDDNGFQVELEFLIGSGATRIEQ